MAMFLLVIQFPGHAQEYRDYEFTDMHLHYVDFVVRTQGFKPLFKQMKKGNTKRVVLFGLGYAISWPNIRTDRVTYYSSDVTGTDETPPMYFSKAGDQILLDDFADLTKKQKKAVYPFLQGLNVMDRNEIYYVINMFQRHPELCGIGELLIHKGAMNNVTTLTPQGNSFAMSPVYDFAAANGMPVLFHQNITDEDSTGPNDQLDQIYMKEIVEILERHPGTTFIWAHTGISRNLYVKEHVTVIRRLLTAHPNLYFDLSWFVWNAYIKDHIDTWAQLVIDFPDRFMLGSDKIGNFDPNIPMEDPGTTHDRSVHSSRVANTGESDEMLKYRPLLKRIDELSKGHKIADQLAHGNINRLLDRIPCGCKSGKPIVFPWNGEDPWEQAAYARPSLEAAVKDEKPITIAINKNVENIGSYIKDEYYRWDLVYRYTGFIDKINIPKATLKKAKKQGLMLFAGPGFKKYTGLWKNSEKKEMRTLSAVPVINFDYAFAYANSGKKLFPNGNWPTLPWWRSECSEHGSISKVLVPKGKILVLYSDEYFRGKEVGKVPYTKGKLFDLKSLADKTNSFQFIPVPKGKK